MTGIPKKPGEVRGDIPTVADVFDVPKAKKPKKIKEGEEKPSDLIPIQVRFRRDDLAEITATAKELDMERVRFIRVGFKAYMKSLKSSKK